MKMFSVKVYVYVLALLLQGCSSFGSIPSRQPSSEIDFEKINEYGIYLDNLEQKNQIVPGKVSVHFNLPPYIDPGGIGITKALKNHIKNAKKSIKIAVFQFNQKEIFDELKLAASRGVKVFISTDLCYSGKSGYQEHFEDLINHLETVGQARNQVVDDGTASCETMFNHNKYFIFDDSIALVGSYNPTNHGSVENVELAIVLNSKEVVEILSLDFEQLLAGVTKVKKKGVYKVLQKGQESIKALADEEVKAFVKEGAFITYPSVNINGHIFEFILSPKVKSLSRVIEEIYVAEKEILFSSFAIADQMLISAIVNKHKGINVSPVLLLPHPGESSGVIIRQNKSENEILDKNEQKVILGKVQSDLEATLSTSKNYLTPKGEVKKTYRYIYPKDSSTTKVRVEGIFNNKVIEEENTKGRLEIAGIKLFKSNLNGELHNKLFIIDEKVSIFGSHNFSQSAENSNDELTVIVKSPGIAKFLKNEYYEKTKYFSVPTHKNIKIPTLAITEIMSESPHQFKQARRTVDAGEYIEVYNFGKNNVNLLGFRLDDRFFPARDGETMGLSSNPGFSGELTAYIPNTERGKIGKAIFDPEKTILKPGKTALIVGKYFHESFYKEKFEKQFLAKYRRIPQKDDYPLLLTFGAHYSSVVGDSTNGLRARDKISLYHLDNHTVIDRFEHPELSLTLGQSLVLDTTQKELEEVFERKIKNSKEESLRFFLKNGKEEFDSFFGLSQGYSKKENWKVVDPNEATPGIVQFAERAIASEKKIITIAGSIADPETNSFKNGFLILENDKIREITTQLPTYAPEPSVQDVLIFPGLIDGHNHLKYNFFPLWVTDKFYKNRYEWPLLSSYTKGIKEIYKKVYTDIEECMSYSDATKRNLCFAKERCHVLRFGEIKALLGGTTSLQGSTSFDETTSDITFRGLTPYYIGTNNKRSLSKARILENMLDECSADGLQNLERIKLGDTDTVRSTAQPINSEAFGVHNLGTNKFDNSAAVKIKNEYSNQQSFIKSNPETWQERTRAFYYHLGEGVDNDSKIEWEILSKLGLSVEQSVVIHGLGFKLDEAKKMSENNVPLIWSPTSNALLYKAAADIPSFKSTGVLMGLGSDWSLSGTKSMLYELKFAKKVNDSKLGKVLTDHDLFKMATINNAKISGFESYLGRLDKNYSADFFIVEKRYKKNNPAQTLLELNESMIHSTWVKGVPQTGDYKILESLNLELDLNLKLLNLSQIESVSCSTSLGYLSTEENIKGIFKVIERYKKAYNSLNPKIRSSLNQEFSNVDGFCQERDQLTIEKASKALGI